MVNHEHQAFFIDGQWRTAESTSRFDVVSPRSEERIGGVPAASNADIDAAVAAARKAFDESDWPRLTPAERGAHCARLADAIHERADELAELISEELGCTLFLSQVYQAVAPVMSLNYAAEVSKDLSVAQVRVSDLSAFAGASEGGSIVPMAGNSLVVKEPAGVAAIFPAYNFALPALAQKAGPALVAGCTVVLKAPEPNPLALFVIGALLEKIGFPPGVLNIVAARAEESEYLVRHPDVDIVSFTGSTSVGRRIGAICGELVRPVVLELGGKSAAIILEDADPDVVVPTLMWASVGTNSGQSCVAQTRLLVPRQQYETYADAFAEAFAALKVGDPMEADTSVGPLVTEAHRERVERHIEQGLAEGATVKTGGKRPTHPDRGWYIEPTLLTGVHNEMTVAREEIFGPVAVLIPHDGEADAIRIANDSEFGLAGSVFTADPVHGYEIGRQIRTGTISINTFAADLGSPFGGFKRSGIGREHGVTAVQEYLLEKTISIDPGETLPDEMTVGAAHGSGPGTL